MKNKVKYTNKRNYRDVGIENEIIEEVKKEPIIVKNLKEVKESKFENFKKIIKAILPKK